MLGWVPMASMVTMQPSSAMLASNSGIAIFSFDFAAVARCPSTRPAPATKALTKCNGVPSTLPERRLVLPSRATTSSFSSLGATLLTQRRKAAPNAFAPIVAKTRPKGWPKTRLRGSCEGMRCSRRRYCRNQTDSAPGAKDAAPPDPR